MKFALATRIVGNTLQVIILHQSPYFRSGDHRTICDKKFTSQFGCELHTAGYPEMFSERNFIMRGSDKNIYTNFKIAKWLYVSYLEALMYKNRYLQAVQELAAVLDDADDDPKLESELNKAFIDSTWEVHVI